MRNRFLICACPADVKYQIPNTKYTCNTGQTRNKLLEQWVHLTNHTATATSSRPTVAPTSHPLAQASARCAPRAVGRTSPDPALASRCSLRQLPPLPRRARPQWPGRLHATLPHRCMPPAQPACRWQPSPDGPARAHLNKIFGALSSHGGLPRGKPWMHRDASWLARAPHCSPSAAWTASSESAQGVRQGRRLDAGQTVSHLADARERSLRTSSSTFGLGGNSSRARARLLDLVRQFIFAFRRLSERSLRC